MMAVIPYLGYGMTVKEVALTHPSDADDIDFDDENEGHLAGHGVTALEVWQVFDGDPLWAANKKGMAAEWLMIGRTYGGRPLVIAVTYYEDVGAIRPITGRTCEPAEVARWKV